MQSSNAPLQLNAQREEESTHLGEFMACEKILQIVLSEFQSL
jgi:hypothetical protein